MPFVTSGKISKEDIAKLSYIAMVHGGELPEGVNSLLATKKYDGIKLAFDNIKPTQNLHEPFINNPGYVSLSSKAALIALHISREMEKILFLMPAKDQNYNKMEWRGLVLALWRVLGENFRA